MRDATPQEIELGTAVKTAQDSLDVAEGRLSSSKTMIADMTARKQKLNTEAELLGSKETLTKDLKHRLIDIEGDVSAIDANIGNLTAAHQDLQHDIDMRTIDLQGHRQAYSDATAPPSVSGMLSEQDILTLQTSKPRTKQSHQEQVELINRYGREAFEAHCPMI